MSIDFRGECLAGEALGYIQYMRVEESPFLWGTSPKISRMVCNGPHKSIVQR